MMQRIWLSLVVLLLIPLFAFAKGPVCDSVFLEAARGQSANSLRAIGDSKEPAYIPTGSIQVLTKSRIQNQCKTSECYLFSYVGMLETANLNILNRPDAPKISAPYLFAQKMLQWSRETAWRENQETSAHLKGGFFYDSLNLTRRNGLVTEDAWAPKISFDQWDMAQLYSDVQAVAQKQNEYVHGGFFRNLLRRNTEESRKQRYLEILPELNAVIEKWTGPLPLTLDHKGQKLQTKDLERMYGIDHRTNIEMMYPAENFSYSAKALEKGFNDSITAYGGTWKYGPAKNLEIETKILKWVQKGAPVMLELHWGDGGHAMIVTGYEAKNGTIERWKLQNSWGDKWSDAGSAWYTVADLRKNLRSAYFVGWDKLAESAASP